MQKPIEGVVIGCCVNQNLAEKPKKRLTKPTEAYQPKTAAHINRGGGRHPRAAISEDSQVKCRLQNRIAAGKPVSTEMLAEQV